MLVAGLQFLEPLLFGQIIGLLARSPIVMAGPLWTGALHLLAIWAMIGLVGIGGNIIAAMHSERLAHRNRLVAMTRFYAHVLGLPPAFHVAFHSGRLVKTMIAGADALFGFWLILFRDQISTLVATLVLLPLTLLLNWRLALSLIGLVALYVLVSVFVIRRTEERQRRARQWQVALAGTAQDSLANVTVLQSFTRIAAETQLFRDFADQVIHHQFPVLTWWAVVRVITRAASTIGLVCIVLIGTLLHLSERAGIGEIVTFMGLAVMLISRLDGTLEFGTRLFMEAPNIDAYFAVLDTSNSVADLPDAPELRVSSGEVRFECVGFAYPGGPPVLSAVSFSVRPGQSVAVVGHTGAGKSTAMALLQRFWDPSEGCILIDGQDIRSVGIESLRRAIGVVSQESMLLNRSIRENLLIGRPDATQADIERACILADVHDFIMAQPNGYDTPIGERGVTLSGGQRQRLAIARAALKDPPIVILDEATSALDAATEARVTQALKALMTGRTTFVVAHRLSTIRNADEILVFDRGRIVERGGFESLMAGGGQFGDLVAAQLAPDSARAEV